MKWDKPNIDYKIHISYSKRAQQVITDRLIDKYGFSEACRLWNRTKHTFPKWFSGENQRLINIIALAAKPLINLSINRHVCRGEWNNAWRVIVNPKKKPKEGMRAVLVGCPIVDFAKKHNLMHLMPAMCNGDYGSMPYLRLDTIRPKTVAKGDKICDNYILNINSSMLADYDGVAFGCPAMGAEVLEENEYEPMFIDVEGSLSGKKIALFGSYGWGDGQWMRDWEERANAAGARLAYECVMANNAPNDDDLEECKSLGRALV